MDILDGLRIPKESAMFFLSIGLILGLTLGWLGLWLLAAREKRSLDNPQLVGHTGAQ